MGSHDGVVQDIVGVSDDQGAVIDRENWADIEVRKRRVFDPERANIAPWN
jgi:hypothetical protein